MMSARAALQLLILAGVWQLPAVAGPLSKSLVVPDKIADQFTPASYEAQQIQGILGERMRVNMESRLLQVDERALINCFQRRPGPQVWSGEHAGKFVDTAATPGFTPEMNVSKRSWTASRAI